MSTKTFFKRIAITAIAALGFGMLSVAPSQSAVTNHSLSIDSATDAVTNGDTATAVLTHSFTNLGSAYDSVVITGIVSSSNAASAGTLTLTVTDSYTSTANDATTANSPMYGYGQVLLSDSTTGLARTLYSSAQGAVYTSARDSITIAPLLAGGTASTRSQGTVLTARLHAISAPGTYVVDFFTQVSNGGAALSSSTVSAKWTITVTNPDATVTGASTVTLRTGDNQQSTAPFLGTAEATDSSTRFSAYNALATDTTPEATLIVRLKNGTSVNTAQDSFTVTVSGEAYVTATSASVRPTAATGVRYQQFRVPAADTAVHVWLWSTQTAGTATVTLSTSGGVSLGSKTLTFTGAPTKVAVTSQYKKVIQAARTSASEDVVAVTITDAAGNSVANVVTPTIVSGNVGAITTGSCSDARTYGATTAGETNNSSTRDGVFLCSLTPNVLSTSGLAATITVRFADPEATTTTYITTTFDVTMGGAPSTVVLTTDKASYEPGENMVITATAKDSSGNTPYDLVGGPSLTSNKALGASITMDTYIGGISKSTVYSDLGVVSNDKNLFAPVAPGKFTISGLDGQTTPQPISVSATIADDAATAAANAASDAAAEAIDAANAATDAANLAAEAADAATVAAEEARDAADAATAAVEALATEVATLMAALKAQITTLANTVAKIAKKVKA